MPVSSKCVIRGLKDGVLMERQHPGHKLIVVDNLPLHNIASSSVLPVLALPVLAATSRHTVLPAPLFASPALGTAWFLFPDAAF